MLMQEIQRRIMNRTKSILFLVVSVILLSGCLAVPSDGKVLWTALSVALGVGLGGDLIRGVSCEYPRDQIEKFIVENKALMKRMYGNFEVSSGFYSSTGGHGNRTRRDTTASKRVPICESRTELVTPYFVYDNEGKKRAVVNTEPFTQSVEQDICLHTPSNRCSGDCGCEQKYKFERLLVSDPEDQCKGIFMDWFMFPSSCVCSCDQAANKVSPSNTGK